MEEGNIRVGGLGIIVKVPNETMKVIVTGMERYEDVNCGF